MKVEDYKFMVNGEETAIDEWFIELKKMFRTDYAFEEAKKDVYKKIEDGVHGWNWESKFIGLHLQIQRKKEEEVLKDEFYKN